MSIWGIYLWYLCIIITLSDINYCICYSCAYKAILNKHSDSNRINKTLLIASVLVILIFISWYMRIYNYCNYYTLRLKLLTRRHFNTMHANNIIDIVEVLYTCYDLIFYTAGMRNIFNYLLTYKQVNINIKKENRYVK